MTRDSQDLIPRFGEVRSLVQRRLRELDLYIVQSIVSQVIHGRILYKHNF